MDILTTTTEGTDSSVFYKTVSCFINSTKINETFEFDTSVSDVDIFNYITANLITKGYNIE